MRPPSHDYEVNINDALWKRMRLLAGLWDELATLHSKPLFRQKFRPELEHLGRFQQAFPGQSCAVLIQLLEMDVVRALNHQFSRGEILLLRARVTQSN